MSRIKRSFRFWLLVAILISVTVSLTVLLLFHSLLADYERSPADKQAQFLLQELQNGEYDRFLQLTRVGMSPFEQNLALIEYLDERLEEGSWEVRQAESPGRGKARFHFYTGGKPFASVVFERQARKSRFGFSSYQPAYVEHFFPAPQTVSVTILEQQTLLVNGIQAEDGWITQKEETGDLLRYCLQQEAEGQNWVTYTLSDLYFAPKLQVLNPDGTEVTLEQRGGEYRIAIQDIRLWIPEFASASVNGCSLEDRFFIGNHAVAALEAVPDGYFTKPVWKEYRIVVLGNKQPDLLVTKASGERLAVREQDGLWIAGFDVPEDQAELLKEIAVDYAKRYCRYNTGDTQTGQASDPYGRSAFLGLFLKDMSIYKQLSRINPYYFTNHVEHWFEEVSVENLQQYTEDCFGCDVSFQLYIRQFRSSKPIQYWTPLSLTFVRVNGRWYIGDLTIGPSSHTTPH